MIMGAWIMLIALMTLIFSEVLDRQNNPNQELRVNYGQAGVPEVILKRNRAGHYVATGSINGQQVYFLLDTGATDVAVPQNLANKLNLPKRGTINSQTANGIVRSTRTQLDEVKLGAIKIANVDASILPSMPNDEVLLGMSFLKQLEMIQRGDSLTLRKY